MVLATLLFVTQDVLTQALARSYPPVEIAWARFTFHTLMAAVVVRWYAPQMFRSRRPTMQITRSALLLITTLLSTFSLQLLPIMEFTAIIAVAPVLVTALSVPLLGERVDWRAWCAVLAGLAGTLLIVGPAGQELHWAVLLPVMNAITYATYQIVTRQLGTSDPPLTTFFYTGVAGAVFGALAMPVVWVTPDATGWAMMIALGGLGGTSHYCLIRAYTRAPAAAVAPFGYTTLLWSALYSLAIAGVPAASTLIGAAIVVASGLYSYYRPPPPPAGKG